MRDASKGQEFRSEILAVTNSVKRHACRGSGLYQAALLMRMSRSTMQLPES